jgi:uncharacterized damage-inducible protein DinB
MLTQALLQELEQESATTRRVLERVPQDRLTWKPHPKSMSIGELAMHVAMSPGVITEWAVNDTYQMKSEMDPTPQPATIADVLAAHDEGADKARAALAQIGDTGLQQEWKLTAADGSTVMAMPKVALVRAIAFNHTYHHRGQLSVYLRLLDVPVPSIYGPSADENPFAAQAEAQAGAQA